MRFTTRKRSQEFRRTGDGRYHFLNLGLMGCGTRALLTKEHRIAPFRESALAFFLADDAKRFHEICELTSYLPSLFELQEWMIMRQRQAPPRINEMRKTWGDSVWDSLQTTQIWPLLSHVLNLVYPTHNIE
jgi:hypothetical protein